MTVFTFFSFVMITVFAYVIVVTIDEHRRKRSRGAGESIYDPTEYKSHKEPFSGVYSFGDFFTTPQAQMPGYFEGTRVRCTDGCMYRTRNQGVSVDNTCVQMCMNSDSEQEFNSYMDELTKSINAGAIVYDH